MEEEISKFKKIYVYIWVQVIACLCYCYKGFPKLSAILPLMTLFLALPLGLGTMHLVAILAFFISWLANSKLLLFAFGKGPLSDPSFSLKQFLIVASFPIKIHSQNQTSSHSHSNNSILKSLIFAGVVTIYCFSDYIHPTILYCLHCLNLYLSLEIILAMVSVLVQTILGNHPGPYFDEPYLSSIPRYKTFGAEDGTLPLVISYASLCSILRSDSVCVSLGPNWALLVAVFVIFLASGLIHELQVSITQSGVGASHPWVRHVHRFLVVFPSTSPM